MKKEFGEIRETTEEQEEKEIKEIYKDPEEEEEDDYAPRRMDRSATVVERAPKMDSLIEAPAMDKVPEGC